MRGENGTESLVGLFFKRHTGLENNFLKGPPIGLTGRQLHVS